MLVLLLSHLPHLLLLSLVLPFAFFLLDRNGLRKFPAPSYAALSSLWRIQHNLAKKHYLAVHNAHERLGTHVRIAPNHISVLDARAPYDIYGHGANMLKEAWYDAAAGPHRNLADARDKVEHQAKRKMLAHTFAPKTVMKFEPVLQERIRALRDQLDSHAASGGDINMRWYLNFFTIDFFGKILYGADFGCLERGDDKLCAETKAGDVYKVPFIDSLLDATVINTLLAFDPWMLRFSSRVAQYHPFKKAGRDWEAVIYHSTKKRMAMAEPPETEDLFTKLLKDSKGQDLNLSEGEILAECSLMMNAGTETTTAALTNTIFLLYKHPHTLAKLREEIDAAFPADTMPDCERASRLPYLRACIEESLRLRPASSIGLPRVVPAGGREIAGQFIPEGVTVSVPTYSLLRDKNAFASPEQYIPDRWLTDDPEEKRRMNNNHLPFSTGPRACIGRNIAYMEQIALIATVVKLYDFEMPAGFELETIERFNSNPGEFPVRCRARI